MDLMECPKSRRRSGLPPKSLFSAPTLIKLVSFFPLIWDPKRPDYKAVGKVAKVWKYIASRFYDGTTPQECKSKWETTLTSRQKFYYRKRQQEMPSGSAAPPSGRKRKEHFEYEHLLSFMPTVQGSEATEGNVSVLNETFASGVSDFSFTSHLSSTAVLPPVEQQVTGNDLSMDHGPQCNSTPLAKVDQRANPKIVAKISSVLKPKYKKKIKLSPIREEEEADNLGVEEMESDIEEIPSDIADLPTKVELKKKKQETLNANPWSKYDH